jgi:hypothetical protein
MLVSVVATICLGVACRDVPVTNSRQDATINMQWCGNAAPPALSAWMAENWPGYRLAGWKCQLGERGTPT